MKHSCLIWLCLAVPLLAAPPRLVIEAESAVETEAPMVVVTAEQVPAGSAFVPGASGDSYLEIPEKAGNPPKLEKGFARFEFDLPADGDYILWARVWWEGECSNSFTVQIDDQPAFLFGENATYRTWHWVKYPVARITPPLRLEKGPHVLRVSNREDGVRLDQILLSPNKRFVPVGIETPTTTGGGTP
ncbi:MAG: hypothetical protein GX174_03245 [Lentisphaerae bacterium]|jgi:hypothetical protein|nr:hypothetical protein [Lentisphaerota bacterium]